MNAAAIKAFATRNQMPQRLRDELQILGGYTEHQVSMMPVERLRELVNRYRQAQRNF